MRKEEEFIHELLSSDGSAEVVENFTSSAIGRTGQGRRDPSIGPRCLKTKTISRLALDVFDWFLMILWKIDGSLP
jgi:hypothetical protein